LYSIYRWTDIFVTHFCHCSPKISKNKLQNFVSFSSSRLIHSHQTQFLTTEFLGVPSSPLTWHIWQFIILSSLLCHLAILIKTTISLKFMIENLSSPSHWLHTFAPALSRNYRKWHFLSQKTRHRDGTLLFSTSLAPWFPTLTLHVNKGGFSLNFNNLFLYFIIWNCPRIFFSHTFSSLGVRFAFEIIWIFTTLLNI
jgi:hypothetical protein